MTAFIAITSNGPALVEVDTMLRAELAASSGYQLVGGVARFVTPQQFGAKGDGVTDDSSAFVAAIAYLQSIATNLSTNGFYKASPELYIPAGKYYLGTTTLDITHTFRMRGDPCAKSGIVSSTWLQWADGCTGVRIQRYNTYGASGTSGSTHSAGDGFSIEDLRLSGGYAGTESESHGIHARARITAKNVNIDGFSGDGVHSDADDGGGSGIAGNSNGTRLEGVTATGCRDGLSLTGANSNAWIDIDGEYSGNRRWGKNITPFLGFTSTGGQLAGNGLVPGTPPSVVSNGTSRYAIVSGQEPTGSTTSPSGTADTSVWYYVGPGGANTPLNIPLWSSGMSLRAGGAALLNNANGQALMIGKYVEGGQGPIQGSQPALVIGGQMQPGGYGVKGGVVWVRNYNGYFATPQLGAINAVTGIGTFLLQDRITFQNPLGGNDLEALWFNNDLIFSTSNVTGNSALFAARWLGQNTSNPVGAYRFNFDNGFGVSSKKWFPGTAAPTTGAYNVGDMIWNTAPAASGNIGWVCTGAGSPGTWKTFGSISA